MKVNKNIKKAKIDLPVLKLSEIQNQNRWIIGTPPAIPEDSPFYSEHLQISYIKSPNPTDFLSKERLHSHKPPIVEIYLVLEGHLEIEIDGCVKHLNQKELIAVPPDKNHQIKNISHNTEFLVLRAPASNEETKTMVF